MGTLLLAAGGCRHPNVDVTARQDEIRKVGRVGVLLFEHPGREKATGKTIREESEIVTEIFSIQIRRYFPEVVERFEIESALIKKGEKPPLVLTAKQARELGERFGCDAFFTGRIMALEETTPLISSKPTRPFALSVSLISARSGEVLLTSSVDSRGGFLMPFDTPQEVAIYSVRKMVEEFGLDEAPITYLTRDSELWRRAMRAYEERRFWDAACCFGEAIANYPVNALTEEAHLYLGRCFEELALPADAERAWTALATLFPKSPFRHSAVAHRAALAYRAGRVGPADAMAGMLRTQPADSPARQMAAYEGALALMKSGAKPRAVASLMGIPDDGDHGAYARYALAECYAAMGREADAITALEESTREPQRSAGHEALAANAWAALGRNRLQKGDDAGALAYFTRVPPRADVKGDVALGMGWAHLRMGNAAAAAAALAGAGGLSDADRIEARLLTALAQRQLGRDDLAEAALRDAERDQAALARIQSAAEASRDAELTAATLAKLTDAAWAAVMRRPGPERTAVCDAIGAEILPLGERLAGARDAIARAEQVKTDAPRFARLEEKSNLLLADLLVTKGRGSVARRGAGAPATSAGGK